MSNKKLVLKKLGKGFLHLLFWCGVLVFFVYFFGYGTNSLHYVLSFVLFLMPITIITTYFSIYKLIPDYLIKKRYFLFGLYSLYTLIVSGYLIILSIFYGLVVLSNFKYNTMPLISRNILFVMVGVYLVVIIASTFKSLRLNLKNIEKTSQLETKVIETQLKLKEQELNYLKMQIHPHFLFNTLNTMYGFALRKANETPEMILKLSNLLDYLLYQVDQPSVFLIEEINHIEDYIELEKMRFNASIQVSFTYHIPETVKVAPMLFLPFIENSFKHGSIKNKLFQVKIELTFDNNIIYFRIENNHIDINKETKGIGLENIKKRLDMLYKDRYTLRIENQNELFIVHLNLVTV